MENKMNVNEKFELCIVGLEIANGKYILNQDNAVAGLVIKANKKFKMAYALLIANNINYYMPNLSTGKFYIKIDGINFTCELVR